MYQTYRRYYAKTFNIMTVTKITDNVIAKIIKLPIFIQIYNFFFKNFFQTRPFLKIGLGGGKTRGYTKNLVAVQERSPKIKPDF